MRFVRQHRSIDANRLAEFEHERGVRLPDSYRAFLLGCNGGYAPRPGYLAVPGWNQTIIQAFMGIDAEGAYSIESLNFLDLSSWLDRHMLPMAEVPNGQGFVLDLRPRTFGKIYVRDHDSPPNSKLAIDDAGMDETDRVSALIFHPIADSFEEFIDMLGPEPD